MDTDWNLAEGFRVLQYQYESSNKECFRPVRVAIDTSLHIGASRRGFLCSSRRPWYRDWIKRSECKCDQFLQHSFELERANEDRGEDRAW